MQKSLQAISILFPFLSQYNRKDRQGCDRLLLPHGILLQEDLRRIFVAIPKNAARIIQNKAPGPPAQTAVATPTILPVPIVALSAVHKAAKLEISPSPSSSFLNIHFKCQEGVFASEEVQVWQLTGCHLHDQDHKGTPQTRLSTVVKKELIASHIIINLLFLLKSVIYCTAGKQSNNRPFQKSEVQKILFI